MKIRRESSLLRPIIAKHRMWNEPPIIFLVRAIQAGLNDPLAQRVKLRHKKLLELARKELPPLPRAFFVHFHPALNLFLDRQKYARNHEALNAQLIRNIAQQRADGLAHLLAAKPCAASPRQILARNPLRHEPHLPRSDVLVWQQHIARLGRGQYLPQQQVCLIHAAASANAQ